MTNIVKSEQLEHERLERGECPKCGNIMTCPNFDDTLYCLPCNNTYNMIINEDID